MQNFTIVKPGEIVADSLLKINNSIETVASNFSGTAFPTDHLIVGMSCYREDLGKKYTLKSINPIKWEADNSYADQAANADTVGKASLTDLVEQLLESSQNLSDRLPKSGFFQQVSPTAYYPCNGWTHLINCQHSNLNNNYALQIAGGFYDQNLFFRKTNGDGKTGWKQFATTDITVRTDVSSVIKGDSVLDFGPNSQWGGRLRIGGNGHTDDNYATVATSNGNLHIDSKLGNDIYLNYYSGAAVRFGKGGTKSYIDEAGTFHGTADYASYLWSTTHRGQYYISNVWDGTYWYLTSNHGAPVRVGYADNAGTVQGFSADTLRNRTSGRNTPVMTPIMVHDNWGTHTDSGMSGKGTGNITLTQDYRNFDKILIIGSDNSCNAPMSAIWEKWELEFMFNNTWRFNLYKDYSLNWWIYSSVNKGTTAHSLSTGTLWYIQQEDAAVIEIYGLNY